MQGHLPDAKDLAGQTEQQRKALKVTKPQAVKGGDAPHVTQKTTASHPPDPWIGMRPDGDRCRLG